VGDIIIIIFITMWQLTASTTDMNLFQFFRIFLGVQLRHLYRNVHDHAQCSHSTLEPSRPKGSPIHQEDRQKGD
jgi:hypothetical protein